MSSYVTAVTLSTEVEEATRRAVWRLDWVEEGRGRVSTWTMSHYSEAAARRHATGLCSKRPPGTTVADIFTDNRAPGQP